MRLLSSLVPHSLSLTTAQLPQAVPVHSGLSFQNVQAACVTCLATMFQDDTVDPNCSP
jgi:hypothetical protein